MVKNDYLDYLYHHGIKGQKWGVRRYQNEDGSLTPEGARRYFGKVKKQYEREWNKEHGRPKSQKEQWDRNAYVKEKYGANYESDRNRYSKAQYEKRKRNKKVADRAAIGIGAAALATYAGLMIYDGVQSKGKAKAKIENDRIYNMKMDAIWHEREGSVKNKSFGEFREVSSERAYEETLPAIRR